MELIVPFAEEPALLGDLNRRRVRFRPEMWIDGESVVKVDIHACFLTLLLGITGTHELPAADLYGAIGLPREPVKARVVQTFGTGKIASRWSR